MKKLIFTGLLFMAFSLTAQELNTAKLDSLLRLIVENDKGMGSLSIFKNGEEVYQKSVGYADLESKVMATEKTKYRVGSVSKMLTATILMQLAEEGKISLDTKLSKFYPDIPNAEEITIAQLLTHQSGIFNFGSDPNFKDWKYTPKTKEELLEIFSKNPVSFSPGEKAAYSNTNYVILTFIIEEIAKKDYASVLESRILDPLGLKNTHYGGEIKPEAGEAFSYIRLSEWQKDLATHPSITRGAGTIVSTPGDLNRFINALFDGKLVNENSLKEMQNFENRYGIGMYPIPFFKDEKIIGHTGGIDGFATMLAAIPEKDITLAYSANAFNMPMDEVMHGIFSIVLGKEYDLPQLATLKLSEEKLQSYAGVYSGPDFPMKLKVYVENNTLMSQAMGPGQQPFPLDAVAKNTFKFDRAGLTLEFIETEKKVLMKQGANVMELTKE